MYWKRVGNIWRWLLSSTVNAGKKVSKIFGLDLEESVMDLRVFTTESKEIFLQNSERVRCIIQ